MLNTKKSGSWLSNNLVGLIIATLIGVVIWGGKNYMENQQKINQHQQEMNLEFKGSSAEVCVKVDNNSSDIEDIKENDDRQDIVLIRHESDIKDLKKR